MTTTDLRPSGTRARAADRHQLALFVIATLALSWSFLPFSDGGLLPHGPMFAAFLVLAVVSGRRGLVELWRQMTRWRVGWTWYLVAPGIMLAMHGLALAVCAVLGVAWAGLAYPTLAVLLGTWVALVLAGGQWEEPGWLGYLARRLQQTMVESPLTVLLVAGLIRMAWHTPLLVSGAIPWYDYVFGTFALQTILLWLYNRTGGSVLLPLICHLFSNLSLATFKPLVAEPDQRLYWFVFAMVELSVALALVISTRGRLGAGTRTDSRRSHG